MSDKKQDVLDLFDEYWDIGTSFVEAENATEVMTAYNEWIDYGFPDVKARVKDVIGECSEDEILAWAEEWNYTNEAEENDKDEDEVFDFFDEFPGIAAEYLDGEDPYLKYEATMVIGPHITRVLGEYTEEESRTLAETWAGMVDLEDVLRPKEDHFKELTEKVDDIVRFHGTVGLGTTSHSDTLTITGNAHIWATPSIDLGITNPIFEEEEDEDPRFAGWDRKFSTGQL